jgi:hypothetical protein
LARELAPTPSVDEEPSATILRLRPSAIRATVREMERSNRIRLWGAEHSGSSAPAGLKPRKPVNATIAMVVKKRAFDITPSLDEGWSREAGQRFKMPHRLYSSSQGRVIRSRRAPRSYCWV